VAAVTTAAAMIPAPASMVAAPVAGSVVVAGVINATRPIAKAIVVKIARLAAAVPSPVRAIPIIPAVAVPVMGVSVVVDGLGDCDVSVVRIHDHFLRGRGWGTKAYASHHACRRQEV
jgi:hypothetical protein